MLTGHGKQSGCSPIQDPALVDVHHTGYCYLQLGNPGISKPTKSWERCARLKNSQVYLKILAEVKEG